MLYHQIAFIAHYLSGSAVVIGESASLQYTLYNTLYNIFRCILVYIPGKAVNITAIVFGGRRTVTYMYMRAGLKVAD